MVRGELILGADPGLIKTGLGLVQVRNGQCSYAGALLIAPPAGAPLPVRLERIYRGALRFIEQHQPAVMVVEKLIYAQNAQSALKLGHARGVLLLAAAHAGLEVVDYSPREVKLAVTGHGAASKPQIQHMVQAVLAMAALPEPHDVADALALAICHAHRQPGRERR